MTSFNICGDRHTVGKGAGRWTGSCKVTHPHPSAKGHTHPPTHLASQRPHPPTWLLRGHTHPHGISEATPTHMASQRPHPPTWLLRGHTHPHGISDVPPSPHMASQRSTPQHTWLLRGHTHPHGISDVPPSPHMASQRSTPQHTWHLRGHTHPHGILEATHHHMASQGPHPPTWHHRGHPHPHGFSEATPTYSPVGLNKPCDKNSQLLLLWQTLMFVVTERQRVGGDAGGWRGRGPRPHHPQGHPHPGHCGGQTSAGGSAEEVSAFVLIPFASS